MPQAALGFTSRAEGGAIVMTQEQRVLTRTYGGKGISTRVADASKPFREVFEKDVADYLKVVGPEGAASVSDLRRYYSENFPDLYYGRES